MQLSNALDIINSIKPNDVETLADLLPLFLIEEAYALTETVTLRKRKLTLGSMADVVNMLDIVDREGKPFVAPSALTQRRKNLGEAAMKALFECTQRRWNNGDNHPHWNGLTLLGVDVIGSKVNKKARKT